MMLTSTFLSPVDSAKSVSPSNRVCAGRMARASPSCAICATLLASSLVRPALVATTPMTVLPCERSAGRSCRRSRASPTSVSAKGPAADAHRASLAGRARPGSARSLGSTTSPNAFTAISAPTTQPAAQVDGWPCRCRTSSRRPCPASCPTLAPGPRADVALGRPLARGGQAGAVTHRGVRPARRRCPDARSNRIAAGTIGTRATPASKPMPRSSR